ncbi:MAG TPA: glycosyltransferase family 39 protein [Mycobacteriales bacterium]|nr:glycosyltransferase family 39 protein [Mycobacteriales bacterium]
MSIAVVAVSLPLLWNNTAFLDEATYLTTGHVLWHNWLHGGPNMAYPTYLSGAPVIYPVIVALADSVGGLALARALSLLCVLVTLWALDATARRLFNGRVAALAVLTFATVAGAQFLAAFATYDAMALMLVALSVWLSTRYVDSGRALPHAGYLLGAPVLALANATKYATALYDPVAVLVVGLVIAARYGRREGARCAAIYFAVVAALLSAALAAGGSSYMAGINTTTLRRPPGTSTVAQVFDVSWAEVGAIAVIALSAAAYAGWRLWRARVRTPALVATTLLIVVLALTVLLAPVEQAHVRTITSLQKHVTFGAWFAAIAAGWVLARLASGGRGRLIVGLVLVAAVLTPLAIRGRDQAVGYHRGWPDSAALTAAIKPYVDATNAPVMIDDSNVVQYYLGSSSDPTRWQNTYYFQFRPQPSDRPLVGAPAYESAIRHGYFGLVALNYGVEVGTDRIIAGAIAENPRYQYLGTVQIPGGGWFERYVVWAKRSVVTAAARDATR